MLMAAIGIRLLSVSIELGILFGVISLLAAFGKHVEKKERVEREKIKCLSITVIPDPQSLRM